jgi:hypothetical protein
MPTGLRPPPVDSRKHASYGRLVFDHKHYVPILKAKLGEYGALEDLTRTRKDGMTPILEVAPIPWDWGLDQPAKSIAEHLQGLGAAITRAWGIEREVFIDSLYLDDNDFFGDGRSPVAAVLDSCRVEGLLAIPVTGPSRSANHHADVANAASQDGRGVCIRVVQDDLVDLLKLDQSLSALLQTLGVPRTDADLVVDFEHVLGQAATATIAATAVLATLPNLNDWRTLTLASSGFPENLSGIAADSVAAAPRYDWEVWQALVARRDSLPRLPTFGDYAIAAPTFTEIDPRVMRMSAAIRYTADADWVILKGRNTRDYGFGQFNDLCRILIARPEYTGAGFSRGDAYINDCASGNGGPGNATSWRRVGTNHHLSFVVDQIANLPGL